MWTAIDLEETVLAEFESEKDATKWAGNRDFVCLETENGIVKTLGKYEGEPIWTPYFHHWSLMENTDILEIMKADRDLFEKIPASATKAVITELENGFVHCEFE